MAETMFSEGARLIVPKDKASFLEKFGAVFEGSPHFAERVFEKLQNGSNDDSIVLANDFHKAMFGVVESATYDEQLELIRAHPDLGAKLDPAEVAEESISEQTKSGLADAPDGIKNRLRELNGAYKEKFNFPFIFAVKGATPELILESFEKRMDNDEAEEFTMALTQIHRIVGFRLSDIADFDKPSLAAIGNGPVGP